MRNYENLTGRNEPSAISELPSAVREPSIQHRLTKEYKEAVGEDGVRRVCVPWSDIRSGEYDPDFHNLMIENNLSKASIQQHDGGVEVSYPPSLDLVGLDGVLATCRAQGKYDDLECSVGIVARHVYDTILVTSKVPRLKSIKNVLINRSEPLGSAEFTPPFCAEELVVDTTQMQRGGAELTAGELDLQRDTAIRDTAIQVIVRILESVLSRKDIDTGSASAIKQIIGDIEKR